MKGIVINSLIVLTFVFVGYTLVHANTTDFKDGKEELVTFSGQDYDYTLRYPESWNVYEIPGMSYLRVENIDARLLDSLSDDDKRQYFKIEVIALPRNNLALNEWAERQNTTSYPLPEVLEQRNIEVAGQPAIYQIEQFGSFIHPVIFISKKDNVYILNISSSDKSFEPMIGKFLEQLKFK